MDKQGCADTAERAATHIRSAFEIAEDKTPKTALILGTGWGDCLKVEDEKSIDLKTIPGFSMLAEMGEIPGHARRLVYGTVGGVPVIAQRGRIHLNEGHRDPVLSMVRLQVEMLFALGVRNLILTCAAGIIHSHPNSFAVGDVVVLDGFCTLFAPRIPGFGGEFGNPEDTLAKEFRQIATQEGSDLGKMRVKEGGHAMVCGPFFEGRRYDKPALARTGVSCVGMSMLPEACYASLVPGVRVLGLAYLSNDSDEVHSHQTNQDRARKSAPVLGELLERVVARIPTATPIIERRGSSRPRDDY